MTAPPGIEGVEELTEIGRGGFGVVYRGTETEYGRQVAVKVLNQTTDEQLRKRFARERRAMGSLSGHPNIVTVFRDGETTTNQPYLVMEYLPGGSLADQLKARSSFDWREVAEIGAKLADALDAAHSVGILHRDVKPDNVLLSSSGEPKLGDFGIARLDDGFETKSGAITASIAHAPPEVIDGKRADERADVYSLASTLHTLVAGHSPFYKTDEAGIAAMLRRITSELPPALALPAEAEAFGDAITYGLAKDVSDRPDSAKTFAEMLRNSLKAPAKPTPPASSAAAPPGRPQTPTPIPSPPPFASSADLAAAAAASAPAAPRPSGAPAEPLASSVDSWNARRSAVADASATRQPNESNGPRWGLIALVIGALIVAAGGSALLAQSIFGDTEPISLPPSGAQTEPVVTAAATPEVPDAVPTPTTAPPVPTLPPTEQPTPTPALAPDELVRVVDATEAISVRALASWAETRFETSTFTLWPAQPGLVSEVALSLGGDFTDVAGIEGQRTLDSNGVMVLMQRYDQPVDQVDVLDTAVADRFTECDFAERMELPLPAFNVADADVISCGPTTSGDYGYFVITATDDDDPTVVVTIVIASIDRSEADALVSVPATIILDPDQLPAG